MNIVEAYLKFNNKLIILVSGHMGSKKKKLGIFLSDILKMKLINLDDFHYDNDIYDKPDNYVDIKYKKENEEQVGGEAYEEVVAEEVAAEDVEVAADEVVDEVADEVVSDEVADDEVVDDEVVDDEVVDDEVAADEIVDEVVSDEIVDEDIDDIKVITNNDNLFDDNNITNDEITDNNLTDDNLEHISVLDWDNIYKSINWEKFNETVDKEKNKGVIIFGFGFPQKLLKFIPDFHIHMRINKQTLLENRKIYAKEHNKEYDEVMEKKIFNTITYTHYVKIQEDSKIDKFVNVNTMTEKEMRKDVFDYLMKSIDNKLHSKPSKLSRTNMFQFNDVNNITTTTTNKPKKDYNEEYEDYLPKPKNKDKYDFDEYGNDYKNEKKVIDISPISRKNMSSSTSTSAYNSSNSDTDSDTIFMFTKRPRQNN
jgi:hypothetical protein